jgi:hypothetical protein
MSKAEIMGALDAAEASGRIRHWQHGSAGSWLVVLRDGDELRLTGARLRTFIAGLNA